MTVKQIAASEAKQWLDAGEAILLDVREPMEHANQRIVGAQLHPLGTIELSTGLQISGVFKNVIQHNDSPVYVQTEGKTALAYRCCHRPYPDCCQY